RDHCILSLYSCHSMSFYIDLTSSLHDAIPIYKQQRDLLFTYADNLSVGINHKKYERITDGTLTQERLEFLSNICIQFLMRKWSRSEEHTSELKSRFGIVCRLLFDKKRLNLDV